MEEHKTAKLYSLAKRLICSSTSPYIHIDFIIHFKLNLVSVIVKTLKFWVFTFKEKKQKISKYRVQSLGHHQVAFWWKLRHYLLF